MAIETEPNARGAMVLGSFAIGPVAGDQPVVLKQEENHQVIDLENLKSDGGQSDAQPNTLK